MIIVRYIITNNNVIIARIPQADTTIVVRCYVIISNAVIIARILQVDTITIV